MTTRLSNRRGFLGAVFGAGMGWVLARLTPPVASVTGSGIELVEPVQRCLIEGNTIDIR
jgi:hypothetical protein